MPPVGFEPAILACQRPQTHSSDRVATVISSYASSLSKRLHSYIWTTSKCSKHFCKQMHSLLKHKMLQLTLKISLYMAPTCFGTFEPSSGSIRRNLAKVTAFVEIISKNTSLKLQLCSGNMCFSL
jgi:hypothetical protein